MDFSNLVEKIKYLLEEYKNHVIFICSILIFMTVCGFCILLFPKKNDNNKKNKITTNQELIINQDILLPNETILENKYTQVRQKKDKWTEEEANTWFTIPDETEIEKLGQSNDKIINDIIGAAP